MERLLTLYSEVQSTDVRWLWYPFIAIGKITLLQGDPGDGKSSMMMNRANITLRQYQRLESGERNILTSSFGLACRVIEALDMDVSKFYHGDYYLEEELKTTRGKGFRSRKKLSI